MNSLIERFPGDATWAGIGFFVGVVLPAREWFGVPYKLWIVISCFVVVVLMIYSHKCIKTYGFDIDKKNWVIDQVRVGEKKNGKFIIMFITAVYHSIVGAWFGQVVSIILGV